MIKYELHIECKACREGKHASCSQRADSGYRCVVINCTCQLCTMGAKALSPRSDCHDALTRQNTVRGEDH
jgi:hypothetical protein